MLFAAMLAGAQTFPVQNLQVNGTSNLIGSVSAQAVAASSVAVTGSVTVGSPSYTGIGATTFVGTGLNNGTYAGSFTGTGTMNLVVKINSTGTPDTLAISSDGGATFQTTIPVYNPVTDSYDNLPINIISGPVTLFNGVTITFATTTGHTIGDKWLMTAMSSSATFNTFSPTFNIAGSPFAGSFGTQNTQLGANTFGAGNSYGVQNTGSGAFSMFSNSGGYANNGYGALTLRKNTFGFFNNAMGVQALELNTTGFDNTALGQFSMQYTITGDSNTAVGSDTLGYNISGQSNSGGGVQALYTNVTGDENSAWGLWSQRGGTSSLRPAGELATVTLTSGSNAFTLPVANPNILIGEGIFGTGVPTNTTVSAISGTAVTMSANASASGAQALTFAVVVIGTTTNGSTTVTLASSNSLIAVGQSITGVGITTQTSAPTLFTRVAAISGTSLTLSQPATAAGAVSLTFGYTDAQISPSFNTSIGTRSLYNNYSGQFNFAGGLEALYNTKASNNVGAGAEAGFQNVTGTNDVFVGYSSGGSASQPYNASGVTLVGANTWGGGNSVVVGIDGSAGANGITIGQSSSVATDSASFGVGNAITGANTFAFGSGLTSASNNSTLIGGSGNVNTFFYGGLQPQIDNTYAIGATGARWTTVYATTGIINTSDAREKQQIKPIDARVLKAWGNVHFVQFKWNADVSRDGLGAKTQFGVIAQNIVSAFKAEGLDALAYGLVVLDKGAANDGRYGVRYDQVMSIEAAFERAEIEKLKHQRISTRRR